MQNIIIWPGLTKWHFKGATLPSKPKVWTIFWPPHCFKVRVHLTQHELPWTQKGVTVQNFKWRATLQNFRFPAKKWKAHHKNVIHSKSKHFTVAQKEYELKWMWSQMNAVSNKWGLKRLWSQMKKSHVSGVSNEQGLKWIGLKWIELNSLHTLDTPHHQRPTIHSIWSERWTSSILPSVLGGVTNGASTF